MSGASYSQKIGSVTKAEDERLVAAYEAAMREKRGRGDNGRRRAQRCAMKVGAMHEASMTTDIKAKRRGGGVPPQPLNIVKIQKAGVNRYAISGEGGTGRQYRDRHAIRGADLRAALDQCGKVYAYARWTRASARWHVVGIAPDQSW